MDHAMEPVGEDVIRKRPETLRRFEGSLNGVVGHWRDLC
jgi:hypothetical protein